MTPDAVNTDAMTAEAGNPEAGNPDAGEPGAATPAREPSRAAPPPMPPTGDGEIDAALERLDGARSGSLAERIESGEHVHELLRGRLGDLGGP